MGLEDSELVGKTLAGEQPAFEELVNRYRDAVCGVAYHHTGNFDDVQDAAQEAFVQAYLGLAQLRDPEKFGPWLRKITSNVCVSMLRRRRESPVESEVLDDQPSTSHDDDRRAAVRTVVRDALAKLSDKVRLTVTLTYINGYSHDEVASFLEIPVNTVRSRLQHAKKQLREEMISMVDDVLHEDKPDQSLTQRILELMARSEGRQDVSASLELADEQLKMLEAEKPSDLKHAIIEAVGLAKGLKPRERKRVLELAGSLTPHGLRDLVKMDTLLNKTYYVETDQKAALLDEVVALAEKNEDACPPHAFVQLADALEDSARTEEARAYYRRAIGAVRTTDDADAGAQAEASLGNLLMRDNDLGGARQHFNHVLAVSAHLSGRDWNAIAQGMLAVLDDVDDDAARLVRYMAECNVLERRRGGLYWTWRYVVHHGFDERNDVPALRIASPFTRLSAAGKILPKSLRLGARWSAHYTAKDGARVPSSARIESIDEIVTTPAGTFEHCMLIKSHNEASNRPNYFNHLAWFAPSVGLVQFHGLVDNGLEGTMQLKEFSVAGSNDYLPLAIGNTWTYGWADLPDDYAAKETYSITASDGNKWYLSHYHYVYKR